MVTVFDIRENLGINNAGSEAFCDIDVINAPALVVEPYTGKSLAPPGISVGFRMNFPETVYPACCKKIVHPGPLFRKESCCVLVALGIMDIDRIVCNIVITTEDDTIKFFLCSLLDLFDLLEYYRLHQSVRLLLAQHHDSSVPKRCVL